MNTKSMKDKIVEWIRDYMKDANYAIIGISGGKDSSIVAALCAEAIGPERVIGVLMPDGEQYDIDMSYKLVAHLGIKYHEINIIEMTEASRKSIRQAMGLDADEKLPDTIDTNMPARIRMTTLYNVAAWYGNSRVVNTSNLSEEYVGYSTKFGDGVGDFGPIASLTVREVLEIGKELGLTDELIFKVPEDGMSGKSDEEKLGVTYNDIDDFLLKGPNFVSPEKFNRICKLHRLAKHKLEPMPIFKREI